MERKKVQIGVKVKIKPQHWLRALEDGTVVDYRPHSRHSWLVQFEDNYPGGGIEGDKLYFDEAEFAEVEHSNGGASNGRASIGGHRYSAAPNGVDIYS